MNNQLKQFVAEQPQQRRFRRIEFFPLVEALEREATTMVPTPDSDGGHGDLHPHQFIKAGHAETPDQVRITRPPGRDTYPPGREPYLEGRYPELPIFKREDTSVPDFKRRETLPMMVLKGIAAQQGQPKPVMQSEISGTAGAAAMVGFGTIVGSILKYGSNFLIQYGFGAASYGLYTLGFSLVTLVASIFNLGLDDAMVRYVAIYRSKQQRNLLKGLIIFCTAMTGIVGILGALFLLYIAPYLAAIKHSARVAPLLQLMAPIVPLLCMQVIWFGGLQGFKAFKWRVITTRILQPIVLILLITAVLILHGNIAGVAVVTFISILVSALFNLYFLFRLVTRFVTPEREQYQLREWVSFAAPNFLTAIVDVVLESTDTLLLAFFAISNVAIGQYGAAIRVSALISMPLFSLNSMFTPTIAELHSKGEMEKLTIMFKIVTKWAITFSLPIFCIATLFSQPLLVLSGKDFGLAWPLLVAFALGAMFNAGTGSVGYMLLMTGHTRLSFLNSLAAVTVNIILGVILTPRYGAMGTAISTGLAVSVLNLMRLLQVRLLLKMQPYRKDTLKPLAAGLISAILTGILLYLLSISHLRLTTQIGHSIISLQFLLIPVFLACYIGLIVFFKISPEDKIVVDAVRKKFMRGKNTKKK